MTTTTMEELADQRWKSTEDAALIRTGYEMVERFNDRFTDMGAAIHHFSNSRVDDMFNTGISAYERVA